MRLAERGSMLHFIQKYGFLSEKLMKIWFHQITNAINHLHNELNTAHRDLKLDNILISNNYNIKIIDFGFSKQSNFEDLSQTFCGSEGYASPEMVSQKSYNVFQADIFALGVVLFISLNGKMPYDVKCCPRIRLAQAAQIYEFRENCQLSQDCLDVIYGCMKPNPDSRPTTNEILSMNWLSERNNGVLQNSLENLKKG